jgi:hypothetical protein
MRPLAYLVLIGIVLFNTQASAGGASAGLVKLEVIQCAKGLAEKPRLSIAHASEYPKLQYDDTATRLNHEGDGYYILSAEIPKGKYTIRLELHGSLQSEIDLDVSSLSPTQFVERNFDVSVIRNNHCY